MVAIAVLDDYQRIAREMADWSRIEADHRVVFFDEHMPDENRLAQALGDFDVVCVMRERTPIRKSLIDRLPNLKFFVNTGMYNASVDFEALKARGIVVSGTQGPGHPTAELTIGLMIALARQIPHETQSLHAGTPWMTSLGMDLKDRTIGIIGLGRLGARVARVAHAFEMRVIAWSQNMTAEQAAAHGAELVGKDELFRRSDFVTVHVRLSERSCGMIGAREFALMKTSAYLINTSRGPIVDETALVDALAKGTIAGAGLDVFDIEPLPLDHPLRREPRAILTPHLGYVTDESYRAFYEGMVEDIEAWLAGTPIRLIT